MIKRNLSYWLNKNCQWMITCACIIIWPWGCSKSKTFLRIMLLGVNDNFPPKNGFRSHLPNMVFFGPWGIWDKKSNYYTQKWDNPVSLPKTTCWLLMWKLELNFPLVNLTVKRDVWPNLGFLNQYNRNTIVINWIDDLNDMNWKNKQRNWRK